MSSGIDTYIKEKFGLKDVDIRTYSPLTLAYIGDGVFDFICIQAKENSLTQFGFGDAELC